MITSDDDVVLDTIAHISALLGDDFTDLVNEEERGNRVYWDVRGMPGSVVEYYWDEDCVRGRVTVFSPCNAAHPIQRKLFTILGLCVSNHIPHKIVIDYGQI
jgi:hypothetical protein